jgi:hypothetical protein
MRPGHKCAICILEPPRGSVLRRVKSQFLKILREGTADDKELKAFHIHGIFLLEYLAVRFKVSSSQVKFQHYHDRFALPERSSENVLPFSSSFVMGCTAPSSATLVRRLPTSNLTRAFRL